MVSGTVSPCPRAAVTAGHAEFPYRIAQENRDILIFGQLIGASGWSVDTPFLPLGLQNPS